MSALLTRVCDCARSISEQRRVHSAVLSVRSCRRSLTSLVSSFSRATLCSRLNLECYVKSRKWTTNVCCRCTLSPANDRLSTLSVPFGTPVTLDKSSCTRLSSVLRFCMRLYVGGSSETRSHINRLRLVDHDCLYQARIFGRHSR